MIKNSIDFDYAIEQITNKKNTDIVLQNDVLDSTRFNHTFDEIEKTLNSLYEKTRYLEDSIQYAKTFLDTKVREFNDEMTSTIKELDALLDMSKNLSYISYNVPFKPNDIYIRDRDNVNNIRPLMVKDKVLKLGFPNSQTFTPSSVNRVCDSIPYDDNIKTMISDKSYKAIYLEEKLVKNGLTETLIFYFPKPVTVNVLDFVPVNSSIKNIRFGLINGIEERASDYNLNMQNTHRTCIYIKFDLVCINYNTVVYEVEKDKVTDNLWNDLKEYEISKISSLNKNNKLNTEYIISRTTTNKISGETVTENFSDPKGKELVALKLYSYIFGLDTFNFMKAEQDTTGYFISDYINIGQLSETEHIKLSVSHVKDENTCIEYSILDGEKEIPIMPIDIEYIENEPIMTGMETRFVRDTKNTLNEIIKKDGQVVNISFEDARTMFDGGKYSISYTPYTITNYFTPMNKEIRIKAYIRTFGSNITTVPYIDLITIRKFGEEGLWINKY